MSTIVDPFRPQPVLPPADDPYYYGWRYVKQTRPDGSVFYDEVPLSADDVLFPELDDFIMHTTAHEDDTVYLRDVFKARTANDPSAVVLHDCRIDLDVPGLRPMGPDIALFFGVRKQKKRGWSTFYVAKEGVRPVLVVEVTSYSTRPKDVGIKVELYHRARVPCYIIIDRGDNEDSPATLMGRRYSPNGYELMPLGDKGRLWLEPLGLWLGIENDRAACYDGVTGKKIEDYVGVQRAQLAEAEARAVAESKVAAEAEARATAESKVTAEAEARAVAESKVAAEAGARAAAESKAAAETEARLAAEARLRELENELRKLRGGSDAKETGG